MRAPALARASEQAPVRRQSRIRRRRHFDVHPPGLAGAPPAQQLERPARLRRNRRPIMRSAVHRQAGSHGKRRNGEGSRHQHAARPFRQRSTRLFRLCQSAGRARLDGAVCRCALRWPTATRNIHMARAARRPPTRWPRRSTSWKARPAPSSCRRGWPPSCCRCLPILSAGDHALIVNSVYFPTRKFANTVLKRLGIEVEYYDPLIGAGIAG